MFYYWVQGYLMEVLPDSLSNYIKVIKNPQNISPVVRNTVTIGIFQEQWATYFELVELIFTLKLLIF